MKGNRKSCYRYKSYLSLDAKLKSESKRSSKPKLNRALRLLAGITVVGIFVGLLSGCGGNVSKRDVGVGVGAVAGGLIGSTMGGGSGKIATTIIGAGAGALAGGYIGGQMDENERMKS